MAKYKAVIFDMGGVILPQPQKRIARYGNELGLPARFLPALFLQNSPNNPFFKLERGELTINEFYSAFEAQAKAKAKDEAVYLPKSFNVKDLFRSFSKFTTDKIPVNHAMLSASTILRRNGILTAILTNNWIDEDWEHKKMSSVFMMAMRQYYNEVIESAHLGMRKPSSEIYEYACKLLGIEPKCCIFLDDIGQNLKAASALGIKTIKVIDPDKALAELESITGVQLTNNVPQVLSPAPCDPSKVVHGLVETKPGIKIHFVESGFGPPVILLHGFPDNWYGWRHQIPALAAAGYRAIALDQRGYGDSSAPPNIADYSHKEVCGDVIALMDKLGINLATVVGHDWGGSVAWALSLKYPDRLVGVCGVNTPFYRTNPKQNPLANLYKNPGVFEYLVYFQTPGVAEKELETDYERSVTTFFQGFSNNPSAISEFITNVRERGGLFVGMPKIERSKFLSAKDCDFYVNALRKHGFKGPLNWYRNYEENWKWLSTIAHRKVTIPALMVTAENDEVLKPVYSAGMENHVVNLKRLHIKECGHWTPQEQPNELNNGLIAWLNSLHPTVLAAKL